MCRAALIRANACRFADRYSINDESESCVGQGTFGRVHRCRDKLADTNRAVKRIPLPPGCTQQQELANEIDALIALDHPTIVRLIEYFVEGQEVLLVMEILEGPTLGERMRTVGRFPEDFAARCLRHMLKALFCCHCRGIAHNDVSTENFRFQNSRPDAMLVMVDFGLSEQNLSLEISVGDGKDSFPDRGLYVQKRDIWSVGTILFEMLTGEQLFPSLEGSDLLLGGGAPGDKQELSRATNTAYVPSRLEAVDASLEALDLLRLMLEHSTERRVTAQEALGHKFIVRSYAVTALPSSPQTRVAGTIMKFSGLVDAMRSFAGTAHLRRVALLVVAHLLNDSEADTMRRQFRYLARDGWQVEESRLREVLEEIGTEVPEDFSRIFHSVDFAGSGALDYVEFMAAAITAAPEIYCRGSMLRAAFHFFDADGEGLIDGNKLNHLFPDRTVQYCEAMISDACGKSSMTFGDFMRMMKPEGWQAPRPTGLTASWADKPDPDMPEPEEFLRLMSPFNSGDGWKVPEEFAAMLTPPGWEKPRMPKAVGGDDVSLMLPMLPAAVDMSGDALDVPLVEEEPAPPARSSSSCGSKTPPLAQRSTPPPLGRTFSSAAVASAPSEAFAIRQAPGFHRSTLRPFYEAQPVSNVVLGLIHGTSGYARQAICRGCAEVLDLPDGGAFFFMPNPKYHWSPEDVYNPERKVRFVAWWIHPEFCDVLRSWVGSLRRGRGSADNQEESDDAVDCGVGAPGDFGYSGVAKPPGYLHTCRDLAGGGSVRMLDALVTGIRRYIGNVLGEEMLPGAHISAGFHYPVRPQYSTLHLQCRVNAGDVCPGEGRGVDLFRLLQRLREDPQVLRSDNETLFYEATLNLRASILKASEQAGALVREVGPQSLVVGGGCC